MNAPAISALVVVRNEEARLDACLASLRAADELVVVLDRSTDRSAEIARAHGAWWNLVSRPQFAGARLTVVFPGTRRGAQLTRLDRFNQLR